MNLFSPLTSCFEIWTNIYVLRINSNAITHYWSKELSLKTYFWTREEAHTLTTAIFHINWSNMAVMIWLQKLHCPKWPNMVLLQCAIIKPLAASFFIKMYAFIKYDMTCHVQFISKHTWNGLNNRVPHGVVR